MNGIVVVDKPKGLTSRDVVNKVSKILGIKKVGHTGTLDPLATGVLVLTVGKYTKLGDVLTSSYKQYHVKFVLGFETDTLDITGKKVHISNVKITEAEVVETILSFMGTYLQEVPRYSAVKVDGKRLYEYARNGIDVELPKRDVEIKNINNIEVNDKIISFDVLVSKGTYIRSLIRDIGEKLGTYGTMVELKRTKQGDFTIDMCNSLEDIENGNFKLLSTTDILKDFKKIELDEDPMLFKSVQNGVSLNLDCKEKFVIFTYKEENICIYEKKEDKFRMFIKF